MVMTGGWFMALFYPHEFDESIAPGTSLAAGLPARLCLGGSRPLRSPRSSESRGCPLFFVFGELTSNKLYFGQQKW